MLRHLEKGESNMTIKLLDCTLREAPVTLFGKDNIIKTIAYLEESHVDFLECAFLCSSMDYAEGSTHFNSVEQIEEYLKYKKPDICYTACTQWPDYDINLLSEYSGKSVDGIRFVLKKGGLDRSDQALQIIMEKGYKAFLQIADSVSYSEQELVEIIDRVNEIKPYACSISDTYGTMYLEDVRRLFEVVNKRLSKDVLFGFHTHNNLLMANANGQEFMRMCSLSGRDGFIDASVSGCGIGAGNAKTELAITYMNKMYGKNYELHPILHIIDKVITDIEKRCSWGYKLTTFLSGVTDSVIIHAEFLEYNYKEISSSDILQILYSMNTKERKTNDLNITQSKYFAFKEERMERLSALNDNKNYKKEKQELSKAKLKKKVVGLYETNPALFNILRIFYRGYAFLRRAFKI